MAEIKVMTNELKSKIEELRPLNTQFKSAVGELESTEASLNSMWEGNAKTAFHNAFTSDKQQMDNFYTVIELYAQKLEVMLAKYIQAENTNIELANNRTYK